MATAEIVCKFYQTGFCKFQTHCKNVHNHDICPSNHCSNNACMLRHPRVCKYFLNFGRCKFGSSCAYLHKNQNTLHAQQILEIQNQIQSLEVKIKKLEDLEMKLFELEGKAIEKAASDENVDTKDRVQELENNFFYFNACCG